MHGVNVKNGSITVMITNLYTVSGVAITVYDLMFGAIEELKDSKYTVIKSPRSKLDTKYWLTLF